MTPLALMGPRSQRRHDTTLPWLSRHRPWRLAILGSCPAGSPDGADYFAVDKSGSHLRSGSLREARVIEFVGYPGIFGKRCLSPPSSTHGWALSQKISIPGFTQLESSSVPAMIIATLGMTSASSISVDPHSGQKRR